MTGKELKAEYKINLTDGNEYTVKFTMNAIVLLEERYGDFLTITEQFQKISFKNIRTLIYAGLIEKYPKITEQYIGSHVDLQNINELVTTVMEAFTSAFPEAAADGAVEEQEEVPAHIKELLQDAKKKD